MPDENDASRVFSLMLNVTSLAGSLSADALLGHIESIVSLKGATKEIDTISKAGKVNL